VALRACDMTILRGLSMMYLLTLSDLGLSLPAVPDFGPLPSLYFLDLSNNKIRGALPISLLTLSNLKGLTLTNNLLTSTLPSELSKLRGLMALRLGGNKITGCIPSSYGDWKAIYDIDLNGNSLSGAIPNSLCAYAGYYTTINLSGNWALTCEPICSGGNNIIAFNGLPREQKCPACVPGPASSPARAPSLLDATGGPTTTTAAVNSAEMGALSAALFFYFYGTYVYAGIGALCFLCISCCCFFYCRRRKNASFPLASLDQQLTQPFQATETFDTIPTPSLPAYERGGSTISLQGDAPHRLHPAAPRFAQPPDQL